MGLKKVLINGLIFTSLSIIISIILQFIYGFILYLLYGGEYYLSGAVLVFYELAFLVYSWVSLASLFASIFLLGYINFFLENRIKSKFWRIFLVLLIGVVFVLLIVFPKVKF